MAVRYTASATTRTATSARTPFVRAARWLESNQTIVSPETGFRYSIDRLLGEGGFGQVYLARRLGRSMTVPEILCIKVSTRIDGWLREAYFGQLLDEHPRAIRLFDAFPLLEGTRRVLYCLAIEYARHGDLERLAPARWQAAGREHGAPRDCRHPRSARQAPSRADAAPGSHAAEHLRLRGRQASSSATSGSSGSRATAAGSRRGTLERVDRSQRHSRRRRAEMAGA